MSENQQPDTKQKAAPETNSKPPESVSSALMVILWAQERKKRALIILGLAIAGSLFAIWSSLPDDTKIEVLSNAGVTSDVSPDDQDQQIQSLVKYYEDAAKDIEARIAEQIEHWQRTGPADPGHTAWELSILKLEQKRERFRELHERHIENLNANHLTLAAIDATRINSILQGEELAYSHETPWQEFGVTYPKRGFIYELDALNAFIRNESNDDEERAAALTMVLEHCDAREECVLPLGSTFTFHASRYADWAVAGDYLCELGASATKAYDDLVAVLEDRKTFSDWRSWTISMDTLSCLDEAGTKSVPTILAVLVEPGIDQSSSSSSYRIQEAALDALKGFGNNLGPFAEQISAASTQLDDAQLSRSVRELVASVE